MSVLTAHPCVCRLENGLNKLHKTQSEVDVLVENARAMALDVEQKVASANVFAEQVGLQWHRCAMTSKGIMAALAARCKQRGIVLMSGHIRYGQHAMMPGGPQLATTRKFM